MFEDNDEIDYDLNNDSIDTETCIESEEPKEDIIEEEKISKHKIKGVHALKYDTIFKGKQNIEPNDELIIETDSKVYGINSNSVYFSDFESPEEYERNKKLQESVFDVLTNIYNFDMTRVRRKTTRVQFNNIFQTLLNTIDLGMYTYSEIFIEYYVYFSENTDNMYKMLDKKFAAIIAIEMGVKSKMKGVKDLENIKFF